MAKNPSSSVKGDRNRVKDASAYRDSWDRVFSKRGRKPMTVKPARPPRP